MQQLDYEDALKQIKENDKPEDNYLVIKFGYSNAYVFPYKEGMDVIKALNKGQLFNVCNYSSDPPEIRDISKTDITIEPLSKQERQFALVAQLLKVSIKDLNANREQSIPF